MAGQIVDHQFQHPAVDRADQAQALDHRDEAFRGNQRAARLAEAQETLVEPHGTTGRVDNRLIGQVQAVVAKGALDLLGDGEVVDLGLVLLAVELVDSDAVAAALLGLHQGPFGLCDHVEHGLRLVRKDHDAGRGGDVRLAPLDLNRFVANRLENSLGGPEGLLPVVAGQHDPEAVAVQAADHVRVAQDGVEPVGNVAQHGVARLVAEGGVDPPQLIETDNQKGALLAEPQALRQRLLERIAQAQLVEVAGQLVEAGKVFEAGLVMLAPGHDPQKAGHALRRPRRRQADRPAVVDPLELAVGGLDPIFAVEVADPGEMPGQALHAGGEILRVHETAEGVAAVRQAGLAATEQRPRVPGPPDPVGRQIPVIGQIAGGDEGLGQARLDCPNGILGR